MALAAVFACVVGMSHVGRAVTVHGCVGAGQDLGEVGEVLRLLFPDDISGDQGKGKGAGGRWGRAVGTGSPQLSRLLRATS